MRLKFDDMYEYVMYVCLGTKKQRCFITGRLRGQVLVLKGVSTKRGWARARSTFEQ